MSWYDRFVNRTDAYGRQVIINGQCQYVIDYSAVTAELFEAHLSGTITLSLPALDQSSHSKWCCFDSDIDDASLDLIEKTLQQHHWHCVREGQRPGRAGHLWMFFERPLLSADLRLFGHRIIDQVGAKGIEFFPKSDRAGYDAEKCRFKASSLVRLPLGIHRKPGADNTRGWFSGAAQDILRQAAWIEAQPLNPVDPIMAITPDLRRLAEAKTALSGRSYSSAISPIDVDRVLRALSYIPADDYGTWLRVGIALKSSNFDVSTWEHWSTKSAKYVPGACAKKWPGFNQGKVGLGTIFHLAYQNGFPF
jgi:hypothetical protein